jgi:hypothetical protein
MIFELADQKRDFAQTVQSKRMLLRGVLSAPKYTGKIFSFQDQ